MFKELFERKSTVKVKGGLLELLSVEGDYVHARYNQQEFKILPGNSGDFVGTDESGNRVSFEVKKTTWDQINSFYGKGK